MRVPSWKSPYDTPRSRVGIAEQAGLRFHAHFSRHQHKGLHGRSRVNRGRRTALILIDTGLLRVFIWSALGLAYLVGVPFAVGLFKSVAFVALISDIALIETAFSQVAASLAQYTAGDTHQDVEHVRRELAIDTAAIGRDIAKLAALQPGPQATALATEIRRRLKP
jgi:uncharacterized membrane protein